MHFVFIYKWGLKLLRKECKYCDSNATKTSRFPVKCNFKVDSLILTEVKKKYPMNPAALREPFSSRVVTQNDSAMETNVSS